MMRPDSPQTSARPFGLENPGITIKPYPNCWAHHKVLQAVLELREKHAIAPENVERVEVDLQTDKPTYRYTAPKTDLEARYSLGYGIVLALLDGELTLAQYAPERLQRQDTLEMLGRIQNVPAADEQARQTVTICMKNGQRYSGRVQYSKGHPLYDPMYLSEVQEKYRLLAGRLLPQHQVEASMQAIVHLEETADVSDVMDLLVV